MIAIACDNAAFDLKNRVIELLKLRGEEVVDCGCYDGTTIDYPDFALKAALRVAAGDCDKGILLCGTGIGMSITANKVKGIRCAHCTDEFSAAATREHNDANMLAVGARISDESTVLKIVEKFLDTPFSDEERHLRRVNKIRTIEGKYFKE